MFGEGRGTFETIKQTATAVLEMGLSKSSPPALLRPVFRLVRVALCPSFWCYEDSLFTSESLDFGLYR